jgi:uncharacterized protein YcaQ
VTASSPLVLERATLRRLQLTAQRLAGPPARDVLDVVSSLRRVRLDPTNAVARSHELVIWSRLGGWDRTDLTRLIEVERRLVEFDASIVPTAHWPIIAAAAAQAPIGDTKRAREQREWVLDNRLLRRHIVDAVAQEGALPTSAFEDVATRDWRASGWNKAKNVSRMLELLALRGELIRAGRRGNERLWDLPGHWLPSSMAGPLPTDEALAAAIEIAIRAQGAGRTPARSPYSAAPWPFAGLPTAKVLAARRRLIEEGVLIPAVMQGMPGDWFVHRDHLSTVDAVQHELPQARTTFLSPFDAVVSDRDALQDLWGFEYRLEIYVPPAKRRWGYFVLPILHGDRLVGRIDPKVDHSDGRMDVNRIYAEQDAPTDAATGAAIGDALADLAQFAGVSATTIHGAVPGRWATGLRRHRSITVAARKRARKSSSKDTAQAR